MPTGWSSLDPNDPEVIEAAARDGVPEDCGSNPHVEKGPIWKMAMDLEDRVPTSPRISEPAYGVVYIPPLYRSKETLPKPGRSAKRMVIAGRPRNLRYSGEIPRQYA